METSFTKIFAPFYLNTRVKLEFFYSLIISDLDYKAYKNTRFFPTGGGECLILKPYLQNIPEKG